MIASVLATLLAVSDPRLPSPTGPVDADVPPGISSGRTGADTSSAMVSDGVSEGPVSPPTPLLIGVSAGLNTAFSTGAAPTIAPFGELGAGSYTFRPEIGFTAGARLHYPFSASSFISAISLGLAYDQRGTYGSVPVASLDPEHVSLISIEDDTSPGSSAPPVRYVREATFRDLMLDLTAYHRVGRTPLSVFLGARLGLSLSSRLRDLLELEGERGGYLFYPNARYGAIEGGAPKFVLADADAARTLSGGLRLGLEYSIPVGRFELAPWIAADYGLMPALTKTEWLVDDAWRVGSVALGAELRTSLR